MTARLLGLLLFTACKSSQTQVELQLQPQTPIVVAPIPTDACAALDDSACWADASCILDASGCHSPVTRCETTFVQGGTSACDSEPGCSLIQQPCFCPPGRVCVCGGGAPPTCTAGVSLTQSPIVWDDEREQLTIAYRAAHQQQAPESADIDPHLIVLHWTAGESFNSAFHTFHPARLAGRAELQGAGALNVSAHFIVEQDGTIHQLLPVTTMARHVIGLNHVSIGIENVGGTDGMPLTEAQVSANVSLIYWLSDEHDITHVIGHHEYRQLEGTPLFDETDDTYRTTKVDPGDVFMRNVRRQVSGLRLKP
jgi:N-acetylmuramoyl-L-alanine amidase